MADPAHYPALIAERLAEEAAVSVRKGPRGRIAIAAAALLLLTVPLAGTWLARLGRPAGSGGVDAVRYPAGVPHESPPKVEPVEKLAVSPDDARAINAAVPFSTAPVPPARPFRFAGAEEDRSRAIDCLAAAQYYEAGDDPLGQKAVAQVVLNRVRHPAFPKSVCAVVFQGSERTTGCQFTFSCDGAMTRTPPVAAWDRARALARRMLTGLVERKVGYATHYHTDWVVPYWSSSLDKIAEVHTHLFFRWQGWWGTPGAFLRTVSTTEPKIGLMAKLSPAHEGAPPLAPATDQAGDYLAPQMTASAAALATAAPRLDADITHLPMQIGPVRITAISSAKDSFIVELPKALTSGDYIATVRAFCSGRPKCRVMGWREESRPPTAFPIPDAALMSMLFSYIHDANSGLQRLLWNCRKVPQDNPRNCMQERGTFSDLNADSAPFRPVAPLLMPRTPGEPGAKAQTTPAPKAPAAAARAVKNAPTPAKP
jgi:spore germination cell wall hydrolase CwlJ-like protein